MESAITSSNNIPIVFRRLLPVVVPVLLISIGYVDPGKWAATVEGGARFGFDLVVPMLVFNLAAMLCQYLSARIGVVTGRDLAEICTDEYDKYTCALLGIQAEFSVITSDLTMILGIAHGLNLLLGVDLFTCVFLTTFDAAFYPILAILLVNYKAKFVCIFMAGSVLFAYAYGVFVNQQEISLSMNGILTKLSGESAFALMSLLGASVLPQNFYLHSALVQNLVQPNASKETLCQDHFFAIFCIFSCIFLASYMLMNSSANMFYSTGLVLLTFQDALSLVEQVLHIPLAPFLFLLVLHGSSQVTALTGSFGGEIILHNFFRLEIPGWLHRVTVRIIAIIPAICCVWNAGAEGVYQLLIFTQVMIALTLPSSLVPILRIASSKKLMDNHKMSPLMEFLAMITFIGMLGLNIIFVLEMIFGNSDWAGNLRWNFGGNSFTPYIFLLVTACVSLSLMIWLLATPLKSASTQLDAQGWNMDLPEPVQEITSVGMEITDLGKISYLDEERENVQEIQASPEIGKLPESPIVKLVKDLDLDLCCLNQSDQERRLTTIEENNFNNITSPDEPTLLKQLDSGPILDLSNEICGGTMGETGVESTASVEPIEKTLKIEGEIPMNKCDNVGYVWDPEQVPKMASGSAPPVTSEGPGSFRSLSGKSDDGGTGAGSLSKLAGLGRAARRQLATILDEFWGQLYDLHGQATLELKAMKLDILLGVNPKVPISPIKADVADGRSDSSGLYFPCQSRMGLSDSHISSSIFDSPEQQQLVPASSESSQYEVQRASSSSSMWSHQRRLLDAYAQNSSHGSHLGLDSGERRYSSLRLPQASEGWDNQPATIHGYQIASYLNCSATNRNNNRFNSEFPMQSTLPLGPASYKDSHAYALGQTLQNGMSPLQTSSFQSVGVSGRSLRQSEQSYYDNLVPSVSPNVGLPSNTKKYHSLPDISGISVFNRDKNVQWDSPTGLGLGSSTNWAAFDHSLLSNSSSRIIAPLAFDSVSPSGKYGDALNMQSTSSSDTSSLWSRQPFEQFGVADKAHPVGTIGDRSNLSSATKEATSTMDMQAHLLKSLRHCILKLLNLEGSNWLFKQNDGADEDLIDGVAAREKFISEVESREMLSRMGTLNEPHGLSGNLQVSSVPHCGDGCVWKTELVVSFGVWCIRRILNLSLMESRPELWGKYTYVLNHLQGIIHPAFAKPRVPMSPCFCLQIRASSFHQQSTALPGSNGQLPPTSKPGRAKCTTAPMLLDLIKDVENSISSRRGKTGTAAGDVAFPKGKENLASVLKRYKRRLSNKPAGSQDGTGSRKIPTSSGLYGS